MTAYSSYSDEHLLAAVKTGDEKAFTEFFKRHWRKAYNMAYSKVRSPEVTHEIVQELFTTLWDKRATLNIHNVSAFIFTSVKNKALNYISSQFREKKYWEYSKSFFTEEENNTIEAVEYADLMEAIEEGIATLPEKSKKVFWLSRMEGKSISEIASTLKLSEKSIEYHLTRSLKTLRLHLKDFVLAISILSVF